MVEMAMGNKGDVLLMYMDVLQNRLNSFEAQSEKFENFEFAENEQHFKKMIGDIHVTARNQVKRCLARLEDYSKGDLDEETFEKIDKTMEVRQIYDQKR